MTIPDTTWQAWAARVAEVDRRVEPIAKTPVSPAQIGQPMPPATQQTIADIRVANQDLLSALIAAYVTANEADRSHIRRLFVEHGSFTWAVSYVMKEPSDEELRNCFVYMSMLDQGFDARDYLLAIRSMVQHAKRANLDYRTIMEEIADMSSPVDRFGFGSTRDILQNES